MKMVADKSINLDNIFSLFSPEGEIGKDNDKVFIDLTQNPIYLIGMYKKMVVIVSRIRRTYLLVSNYT